MHDSDSRLILCRRSRHNTGGLTPAHAVAGTTWYMTIAATAHPIEDDLVTFNSAVVENAALWAVQAFKPDNDVHDLFQGEVVLLVLA